MPYWRTILAVLVAPFFVAGWGGFLYAIVGIDDDFLIGVVCLLAAIAAAYAIVDVANRDWYARRLERRRARLDALAALRPPRDYAEDGLDPDLPIVLVCRYCRALFDGPVEKASDNLGRHIALCHPAEYAADPWWRGGPAPPLPPADR